MQRPDNAANPRSSGAISCAISEPSAEFGRRVDCVPSGVTLRDAARGASPLDVIVCFVESLAELRRMLPRNRKRLDPGGGLWLCWPKKASGIKTDIDENAVRTLGLASSLVDNKVCAIDEVWSGSGWWFASATGPGSYSPTTCTTRRRAWGARRCSHRYSACHVPNASRPAVTGIVSDVLVTAERA